MSTIVQLNKYRQSQKVDTVGRAISVYLNLPTIEEIDAEITTRAQKAIPADAFRDLPALSQIASRLEPALRRIFINAVNATKNQIDLEALAAAIQTGRIASRLDALARIETFERRLAGYEGPLRKGFLRGAGFANQTLLNGGITMNFNLMNTHAAVFSQTYVPQLVASIVDGGRENVRRIIEDAVTFGDTPSEAARKIRAQVGFTARDAKAYSVIKDELEASGMFGSALEKKLARVENGFINRRAKTIARTEIIRAANAGQQGLWNEAAAEGLIDKQTAKKQWVATDDELLEAVCRGLDGMTVGLNEEFMAGVSFPPQHVNCRCAMSMVFD